LAETLKRMKGGRKGKQGKKAARIAVPKKEQVAPAMAVSVWLYVCTYVCVCVCVCVSETYGHINMLRDIRNTR